VVASFLDLRGTKVSREKRGIEGMDSPKKTWWKFGEEVLFWEVQMDFHRLRLRSRSYRVASRVNQY